MEQRILNTGIQVLCSELGYTVVVTMVPVFVTLLRHAWGDQSTDMLYGKLGIF